MSVQFLNYKMEFVFAVILIIVLIHIIQFLKKRGAGFKRKLKKADKYFKKGDLEKVVSPFHFWF